MTHRDTLVRCHDDNLRLIQELNLQAHQTNEIIMMTMRQLESVVKQRESLVGLNRLIQAKLNIIGVKNGRD